MKSDGSNRGAYCYNHTQKTFCANFFLLKHLQYNGYAEAYKK